MKIDKITINAVIPTQQYGNLQPGLEMSDVDAKEGMEFGLNYMKELFARYSEHGGLTEHDVVLSKFTKKSFNEGVDIEFEPVKHDYTFQGKPLVGATEYIKRFYKPFDAETISSVLESKWGVPQQVIRDLWDSNGELTSIFGNVVHRALEYYEKFKGYGEIISSQQKESFNYCLPKHPILRSIVQGFLDIPVIPGEIVTEVLVSDVASGICGHADRILIINKEKKICRIQDYKVNIESEKVDSKKYKVLPPFNELPSTKISKYQLQLSIYANMLQKSGWQVEGLDVFVYEETWKHFELPVLKVI